MFQAGFPVAKRLLNFVYKVGIPFPVLPVPFTCLPLFTLPQQAVGGQRRCRPSLCVVIADEEL